MKETDMERFARAFRKSCDDLVEKIEDFHDLAVRKPQYTDFQKERLK